MLGFMSKTSVDNSTIDDNRIYTRQLMQKFSITDNLLNQASTTNSTHVKHGPGQFQWQAKTHKLITLGVKVPYQSLY